MALCFLIIMFTSRHWIAYLISKSLVTLFLLRLTCQEIIGNSLELYDFAFSGRSCILYLWVKCELVFFVFHDRVFVASFFFFLFLSSSVVFFVAIYFLFFFWDPKNGDWKLLNPLELFFFFSVCLQSLIIRFLFYFVLFFNIEINFNVTYRCPFRFFNLQLLFVLYW